MNELARYSLKEVATRDGKEETRVWIVIYDMVYDVTDYKDEVEKRVIKQIIYHPGGPELIEEYAGQDATRGFDEFGHSTDAKRILKKYLVGELIEEDKIRNRRKKNEISIEEKGRKRSIQ
ncbi:Cytochrome b5 [Apis cerana cerana]|uniref:Cytochrome b5 n=1 Tax=Apis cerana cerana TaxID=94128 RepID=A0A2A3E5Z5_APICC|nr:Cytochrome b5 [Apis cerana cerana]